MEYKVRCKLFNRNITATAQKVGVDWRLSITGGDAPHVGAVSFAWTDGKRVLVKSIVRTSHKDQIVGERMAAVFAEEYGNAASVESGIHFDDISKEEIAQVIDYSESLILELLDIINKQGI